MTDHVLALPNYGNYVNHIAPQSGKQEAFLTSPADVVIYGGAAGGGKTWALLLDQLRDIDVKGYYALILRRTYTEITNAGGMWDESEKLYPLTGGVGVRGDLVWRWASGARVEFGHLYHENDLTKYDGAQIACIGFDQLEHFSEKMFFYLLMRNRTSCGVRPRIRATCNPNPDSFLVDFLSYWISEDGYADLEHAGKIRWFMRKNERIQWADTRDELIEQYGDDCYPISVTFIPATVFDNKILLANNPQYLAMLKALPLIERERFLGDALRGGNWKIKPSAGKVFNRDWFRVVSNPSSGGIECRFFDFAGSEKEVKGSDPDYTSSVKVRKSGNRYCVVDVTSDQMPAGEVDAFVLATIERDLELAKNAGVRYRVRWEIEPGSASQREAWRLKRVLTQKFSGINCDGTNTGGKEKLVRWRPVSAAAFNGLVDVVADPWCDGFLSHLHGQPDLKHDDQADALAGAFNELDLVSGGERKQTQQPNPFEKRTFL